MSFQTESVLVRKAIDFATLQHGDQMYGEHPYTYHLEAVAQLVQKYTQDQDIIATAWLHDVVEDTKVTRLDLENEFNERVGGMVWAVTGTGKNRFEKLASVLVKIPKTPGADLVKCADRIANVTSCTNNRIPYLMKKYLEEHPQIRLVFPQSEILFEYNEAINHCATTLKEME